MTMHLAPPQSICTMWQVKEVLSPCYGCMDLPNVWGKGFELLEYRQGEQKHASHSQTPPWNVGPSSALRHRSGQSRELQGLRSSMELRDIALSELHLPNSFHQGLTSLKCQQRPTTGLLLRGHQQMCCPGDGGTPWSKSAPSTSVKSTHLPGIPVPPCLTCCSTHTC